MLTWLSPPRSGPSLQPHSQSCHHLTSFQLSSSSKDLSASGGATGDGGSSISIRGGGVRGGGRPKGFGGGGIRMFEGPGPALPGICLLSDADGSVDGLRIAFGCSFVSEVGESTS